MPEFQWNQPGQSGQGNQGWGQFGQQFQQMGISDPTNVSSIQSALSQMFGREIPKGMITALDQNMLKGTQFETYRPMLESKRDTLLSDLTSTLGGKKTGSVFGGFSGTSSTAGIEQKAKDVYGKGAGDVLQDIGQSQTGARRNIQDMLSQWRTAGQAVR